MNFVNQSLFEFDTRKKGKKTICDINTNGLPKIGSIEFPTNMNPTKVRAHCKYAEGKDGKQIARLTSNPTDPVFKEKDGNMATYLIAIPFSMRIAAIEIHDPSINIFKTCFTSYTQREPKVPYQWAPEGVNMKKQDYYRTLYIVAEKAIDENPSFIRIVESSMTKETAQEFIDGKGKAHRRKVYLHTFDVPLEYFANDKEPYKNGGFSNYVDFYPCLTPIEKVELDETEALLMARKIQGLDPMITRVINEA